MPRRLCQNVRPSTSKYASSFSGIRGICIDVLARTAETDLRLHQNGRPSTSSGVRGVCIDVLARSGETDLRLLAAITPHSFVIL